MGCCSPEYRKVVNEMEEMVNQKGRDSLSIWVKVISVVISVGGLGVYFFL